MRGIPIPDGVRHCPVCLRGVLAVGADEVAECDVCGYFGPVDGRASTRHQPPVVPQPRGEVGYCGEGAGPTRNWGRVGEAMHQSQRAKPR